jgi:hypothetical protein
MDEITLLPPDEKTIAAPFRSMPGGNASKILFASAIVIRSINLFDPLAEIEGRTVPVRIIRISARSACQQRRSAVFRSRHRLPRDYLHIDRIPPPAAITIARFHQLFDLAFNDFGPRDGTNAPATVNLS